MYPKPNHSQYINPERPKPPSIRYIVIQLVVGVYHSPKTTTAFIKCDQARVCSLYFLLASLLGF